MSERVRQGHPAKRLGFKTTNGNEYETNWDSHPTDRLHATYDVLRGIDGVERVWIDHAERSLDTGENE